MGEVRCTTAVSHWVALPLLTAEREAGEKDKPLVRTALLFGHGME